MPYVKWSCKDCKDKTVGCHSTCEKYIRESKLNNELREKDRARRSLYVYTGIKNRSIYDAMSKKAKKSLGYNNMGW